MELEYYLWTHGGQQGPFTREELEKMYREGKLIEANLQYTTDAGETWYPMGHLFAPTQRRGFVGGVPESGVGAVLPAAGAAPGVREEATTIKAGPTMSPSGRIVMPPADASHDRLAPLHLRDKAGEADRARDADAGSGGSGKSPTRKPKQQHRTQRIEPTDSYVRPSDLIKPQIAYRIMRDGLESGPYEEAFLRRWVETGALEKDTPTRRDGTRDWEPLWHVLKMSPPGQVEHEATQGRRAIRTLAWSGKVLVLVGAALLAGAMWLPLMRTVGNPHALGPINANHVVTLWEFSQPHVGLFASAGLVALLAALNNSGRWVWAGWAGAAAGLGWLVQALYAHQQTLRATLSENTHPLRLLRVKYVESMSPLPQLHYGLILLVVGVVLIAVGALVMQLSAARWRRM
ncbi:hypothetical protein DB346_06835 [Verrucomicrobia bacterium LW23]|nr:hypothetical protein DB346_06835 [Verrucomicrobia bacterium LW23]